MQIYESLCVCAIIAGASGAIGRACARLEISPFALAFSGALLLMLSRFSFAPLAEFRCNTGTLVFPVYFLIQMVEQRGLNVRAAATWRAFFAASTLPVVWMLVSALAELWRLDYASVNLAQRAGDSLRNNFRKHAAACSIARETKNCLIATCSAVVENTHFGIKLKSQTISGPHAKVKGFGSVSASLYIS